MFKYIQENSDRILTKDTIMYILCVPFIICLMWAINLGTTLVVQIQNLFWTIFSVYLVGLGFNIIKRILNNKV